MKRVSHMFGGSALMLEEDLSFGVLQDVQNHCDDSKPIPPALPEDKQEVDPAFDLLKPMAQVGWATVDKLTVLPPVAHAAHDAVLLGTALGKLIRGVALEDITEAGYIIYLIQLRCEPYRDGWYLHFVRTVEAFLVVAAFLQRLSMVQRNFCRVVWQPEG